MHGGNALAANRPGMRTVSVESSTGSRARKALVEGASIDRDVRKEFIEIGRVGRGFGVLVKGGVDGSKLPLLPRAMGDRPELPGSWGKRQGVHLNAKRVRVFGEECFEFLANCDAVDAVEGRVQRDEAGRAATAEEGAVCASPDSVLLVGR